MRSAGPPPWGETLPTEGTRLCPIHARDQASPSVTSPRRRPSRLLAAHPRAPPPPLGDGALPSLPRDRHPVYPALAILFRGGVRPDPDGPVLGDMDRHLDVHGGVPGVDLEDLGGFLVFPLRGARVFFSGRIVNASTSFSGAGSTNSTCTNRSMPPPSSFTFPGDTTTDFTRDTARSFVPSAAITGWRERRMNPRMRAIRTRCCVRMVGGGGPPMGSP